MRSLTMEPMRLLMGNPLRRLLLTKLSAHPTGACLNASLRGEIAVARTHRQVADRLHLYPFKDALIACQQSHGQRVERLRALILAQGGAPAAGAGWFGAVLPMVTRCILFASEALALRVVRAQEELLLSSYRGRSEHLNDDAQRTLDAEIMPQQLTTRDTMRGLVARL
jgi:hypothetical protein